MSRVVLKGPEWRSGPIRTLVRTQGAMTPKFELGRDFCTMHLPKFHHPMFTRSEVIVLTNKHTYTNPQTNKQTNRRC